jgi:hypothetical protein
MAEILNIIEQMTAIVGGLEGLLTALLLLQGVIFGWLNLRDSRTKKQLIQTLDKSAPANEELLQVAKTGRLHLAAKVFGQFVKKKPSHGR